ncbi:MAG: hypothetical protein E7571_00160 [Ruminococcaceae bacterium]|nr:hypothetical protein [Oscillospiraceae bacterium]
MKIDFAKFKELNREMNGFHYEILETSLLTFFKNHSDNEDEMIVHKINEYELLWFARGFPAENEYKMQLAVEPIPKEHERKKSYSLDLIITPDRINVDLKYVWVKTVKTDYAEMIVNASSWIHNTVINYLFENDCFLSNSEDEIETNMT